MTSLVPPDLGLAPVVPQLHGLVGRGELATSRLARADNGRKAMHYIIMFSMDQYDA